MKIPKHFRSATRKWLRDLGQRYDFEDYHWKIVFLAAEKWDRHEEGREIVEREGSFFIDRFGQPKPHPALAVMRDSAIVFSRLMRELGLDIQEKPDTNRPPSRY